MKIAIIGIRGIPVIYSAFETCAEVLSTELVKKNHDVTVYARKGLILPNLRSYKGVKICILPHVPGKSVTTFSHSLLATLHASVEKYDIILFLGVGSTLFSILPRFFGTKTIVHIDGMDWKREKWNIFGKIYLKCSEYLTTRFPNGVITDSHYMVDYYKSTYKKGITYIPYGYFEIPKYIDAKKILEKYHLKKEKYFIWVGRLVPENHIEEFLTAWATVSEPNIRCIILGDDTYESEYKKKIYEQIRKDQRIVFKGFIPHEEVLILEHHCLAYIETKRSGGTHMSLVEAMGVGALIVSHNNTANKEVLGEVALYYDMSKKTTSLSALLKNILVSSGRYNEMKKSVKIRAKRLYTWEIVVDHYERLIESYVR